MFQLCCMLSVSQLLRQYAICIEGPSTLTNLHLPVVLGIKAAAGGTREARYSAAVRATATFSIPRVSSGGGGGGGGGVQEKLPPPPPPPQKKTQLKLTQLPPQDIANNYKSTLPSLWPYGHIIRELPPQDEIPR